MPRLSELVAELTDLIEANQTIEAMERFYSDDVIMQENEQSSRVGKAVCLEHERRMLTSVTSMRATLLSQAVNEATGMVFSEWRYIFTDISGQRFSLTEVSVQYWRDELIHRETFYYDKSLTMP